MVKAVKFKQLLLLFGDLAILYFTLYFTLTLRYGSISSYVQELHLIPFTVLFLFWICIFYLAGLYDLNGLKNNGDFRRRCGIALFISFLVAVAFFYFLPRLGITPRTSLFLFLVIFSSLAYVWRTAYNIMLNRGARPRKILLLGTNAAAAAIATHLAANPQLGYEVAVWIQEETLENLTALLHTHHINFIIIPAHLKKNPRAARLIYNNLSLGIEVMDLEEFYEGIFQKVPLVELEEVWFLENLTKSRPLHDAVQRPLEIAFSLCVGIILLPLAILVIFSIKLTSSGSAFFTQMRIGKNGIPFILWKFRTMRTDAERDGPRWSTPNDSRATPIGQLLRKTHLDELPQLLNILRGELSLVGPRPERPEFIKELAKEISFYELRHLIRPGLTGWAQVNYHYGASLHDAYEKLQYDIYYLKHRSVLLDMIILLRTAKRFFINA